MRFIGSKFIQVKCREHKEQHEYQKRTILCIQVFAGNIQVLYRSESVDE